MALDVEGLARQWHLPKAQVVDRLLAQALADQGRVLEAMRQMAMVEQAREAVAELQDHVAEKDRENLALQKQLEAAQDALRRANESITTKEPKVASSLKKGEIRTAAGSKLDSDEASIYHSAVRLMSKPGEFQDSLRMMAEGSLKEQAYIRVTPLLETLRRVHGDYAEAWKHIKAVA